MVTSTWMNKMSPLSKCLAWRQDGRQAFVTQENNKIPGNQPPGQKTGKKSGGNQQANHLENKCSVFGTWEPEAWGGVSLLQLRGLKHCAFCFFLIWVAFIFRKVLFRRPFYYLHHAKEMKGKVRRKMRTEKIFRSLGMNNRVDARLA